MDAQFVVVWVPSELQMADPLTRGASTFKREWRARKGKLKSRIYKARKHSKGCLPAFARILVGDMEALWSGVEARCNLQVSLPPFTRPSPSDL